MKPVSLPSSKVMLVLQKLQMGQSAASLCKAYHITRQTLQEWRNQYTPYAVELLLAMRSLQRENRQLKKCNRQLQQDFYAVKELLETI